MLRREAVLHRDHGESQLLRDIGVHGHVQVAVTADHAAAVDAVDRAVRSLCLCRQTDEQLDIGRGRWAGHDPFGHRERAVPGQVTDRCQACCRALAHGRDRGCDATSPEHLYELAQLLLVRRRDGGQPGIERWQRTDGFI